MRVITFARFSLLFPVVLCLSCRSGSNLAGEVAALKQAGLPTTPQELQAPLPPAEQNAALLYSKLHNLLQKKPLSEAAKVADTGAGRRMLTEDRAYQLRAAYSRRGDVGNLVRQAAEMPQCVFDRHWEEGADLKLPEYAVMRSGGRWLSGESALLLYYGRTTEAIETQALGFRIARHAANDPTLIANLVADALDAIALAGMERILYAKGEKAAVAEAIQQVIEKEWQPHSMAYAMRGEVIMDLVELDKLRKTGPAGFEKLAQGAEGEQAVTNHSPLLDIKPPDWDRFLDANGVILFQHLRAYIAATDRPYPEAAAMMDRINQDIEAHIKPHSKDYNYLMSAIMFPVFSQAAEKKAQNEAKVATVRTGAALLIWKAKHGSFPNKLDGVMKSVPTDPYDGKPIRYKQEGAGFVVYRVGKNGDFDGGTPDTKPDISKQTLFRYPFPDYVK